MKEIKKLYTRKITPAGESPIKNSKPLFGSFSGCFKHFDIKGVKRPFGDLPLPHLLTNQRIISSLRFLFCDEAIIGEMDFFSGGYFSFMETTLWDRKTNMKLAYRQFLPGGFIHLPKYIKYSIIACRAHRRYARIFSRLSKGMLHADFDFLATGDRPTCEGRIDFDIRGHDALDFSSVIPYQVMKRCELSYIQCGIVKGWVNMGHNDIPIQPKSAVGVLDYRKLYATEKTKRTFITGMGRMKGKLLSFQINSSISPDSYSYNDNILFFDGERTPLPPVRITRPYGIEGKWVIQDTENMIDLIFTPLSKNNRRMNAFVFRTEYHTFYGTFEGTILTTSGETIKLKKFPGIGKKIQLHI